MEHKKNLPSDYLIKPLIKLIIAIQLQILRHILMQNLFHDSSMSQASAHPVMKNKEKEFYTTEEVMEMLSVSKRTLLTLRNEGKIGFVKVHKTIRYSRKDIEMFKASR